MKKIAILAGLALSAALFTGCTQPSAPTTQAPNYESAEFNAAVEKGIESYIAKQETEAQQAQEDANKPKEVDFEVSTDDDPVLGDPNAPVTIVEFSDYECPFCSRHFEQVAPKIIKNYVDTGKVKIVFRDLPLGFHANAIPAAIAANCARAQGDDATYFQMHDLLFSNQDKLNEDGFKEHAAELGLDEGKFVACLSDETVAAEISADAADAAEYGVSGTPGFFINNYFIAGAFPYETFEQLIEAELAK